jgi:hypothetical protein
VASPRSTAPLRSRAAEQGGTGAGRHDHNYHSHTTNHDGMWIGGRIPPLAGRAIWRVVASGWPLAHGCVQGCLDVAERSGCCGVLRPPERSGCRGVLRPPGQFGGIDVLVVGLDPPDVAQRVPDPANPVAEAFRLVARGGQNRRTIPAQ